jgi:hypothetical protein
MEDIWNNLEDKDKDIMSRVIAEMIVADIMATRPTTTTEKSTPAEKSVAWIEVYDDVLDEAYDMSKEYREYE